MLELTQEHSTSYSASVYLLSYELRGLKLTLTFNTWLKMCLGSTREAQALTSLSYPAGPREAYFFPM